MEWYFFWQQAIVQRLIVLGEVELAILDSHDARPIASGQGGKSSGPIEDTQAKLCLPAMPSHPDQCFPYN